MTTESKVDTTSTETEQLLGRVKWFNNKAGYGFITVTDGVKSGSDIFVHHSAITVSNQQYKYLVQGEYVEFKLSSTNGGTHEYQATGVCGIKGGKLMCETRNEFRVARNTYKSVKMENSDKETSVRARGEGPRDSESKNWSTVSRGKNDTDKQSKPRGRPPKKLSSN